jgi:hypothetical protein
VGEALASTFAFGPKDLVLVGEGPCARAALAQLAEGESFATLKLRGSRLRWPSGATPATIDIHRQRELLASLSVFRGRNVYLAGELPNPRGVRIPHAWPALNALIARMTAYEACLAFIEDQCRVSGLNPKPLRLRQPPTIDSAGLICGPVLRPAALRRLRQTVRAAIAGAEPPKDVLFASHAEPTEHSIRTAGRMRSGTLVLGWSRSQAIFASDWLDYGLIRACGHSGINSIAVCGDGVILLEEARTKRLCRRLGVSMYGLDVGPNEVKRRT